MTAAKSRLRDAALRIVLTNIGTLGDINPLLAIALELKRRGHVPVMALPEVLGRRLHRWGWSFTRCGRISTQNTVIARHGL